MVLTIVFTFNSLKEKPVLTAFMISRLYLPFRLSAEFLINNEYLKLAPEPSISRGFIPKIESDQRIKDNHEQIKLIEDDFTHTSKMEKFRKIYKYLIHDFYNTRSIATDRYFLVDLKHIKIKDDANNLSIIANYTFVPIQQTFANSDIPGSDVKEFVFSYIGDIWIIKSLIDFN